MRIYRLFGSHLHRYLSKQKTNRSKVRTSLRSPGDLLLPRSAVARHCFPVDPPPWEAIRSCFVQGAHTHPGHLLPFSDERPASTHHPFVPTPSSLCLRLSRLLYKTDFPFLDKQLPKWVIAA